MSEKTDYKQFTEEEERVYRKNIEIIRSNIDNGVKFDLACEFIDVADPHFKDLIIDDALKIEIAELHYGKRIPLRDVSVRLGVSVERLLRASTEMIEDVIRSSEEMMLRQDKRGRPTH